MKGPSSVRWSASLLLLLATTVTTTTTTALPSGGTEAGSGGNTRFTPMHSLFTREENLIQPQPLETVDLETEGSAPRTSAASEEEGRSKRTFLGGRSEEEEQQRRQAKVKKVLHGVRPDANSKLERVSEKEFHLLQRDHPELRRQLWGGSGASDRLINYADPGDDYDMWQQAYRMLGGFIDCDHTKDQGSGDRNNNNNNNAQSKDGACSRWMMWASYVDPNYQGYGYDEYFGEEPVGVLDCHRPDTEWVLLGVYRQEFYQFIEQISKHLWAIDEYEYVVALAGLKYMTKSDCFYVGQSSSGQSIYAGVAPMPYGQFQMALYTDDYCLVPNTGLGKTYDDFGRGSDVYLGSKDKTDDDGKNWAYDWWHDTQEYTFQKLNEVYYDYTFCTSCIDYPTYQDGYVIGDTGMDDDDLINQCWKFYSHDSFPCEADCIALGHSQGTILSVMVGNKMYGQPLKAFYQEEAASGVSGRESKFTRLMANAFVTFSFIVFVATFLAFAVARRSRYRESRGSKSRRLLDDDDEKRSRRRKSSTRGSSSRKEEGDGDGVFRSSGSRKSRSKSSKRKSSSSQARSHSRVRESASGDDGYDNRRSRSRKRSSSRNRSDDY